MAITVLGGHGFIGSRYCELTENVIRNSKYDYEVSSDEVIYFISTVNNYNIFTNPYIDIETNLLVLIKTLEKCKNKDIIFNFVSSWFVYGNVELPASETSYCNPHGFYSITKRTAEQLLISYCETFNIKYRILRLANVLGKSDNKISNKKNVLQFLISEIKLGNDVKLVEQGNIIRDYIYVDDAIKAMNLVIKYGKTNEIYNIGNGKPILMRDVICLAKRKINSESNIILMNTDDPNFQPSVNMVLNISKIKELGYTPSFSIEEILDILLDNY